MRDKTLNKVIKVGKCLSLEEFKEHSNLLHQFPDIFAWSYKEMPRIDESIVVHNIVLSPDGKSMKKKIQKMNPKVDLLVKVKIEKLRKYGFIHSTDYSPWISNIVLVRKLDG